MAGARASIEKARVAGLTERCTPPAEASVWAVSSTIAIERRHWALLSWTIDPLCSLRLRHGLEGGLCVCVQMAVYCIAAAHVCGCGSRTTASTPCVKTRRLQRERKILTSYAMAISSFILLHRQWSRRLAVLPVRGFPTTSSMARSPLVSCSRMLA